MKHELGGFAQRHEIPTGADGRIFPESLKAVCELWFGLEVDQRRITTETLTSVANAVSTLIPDVQEFIDRSLGKLRIQSMFANRGRQAFSQEFMYQIAGLVLNG
jgi:hypothetical protein